MQRKLSEIEDIMTNTKISVILPIFNEKTHLKECLDYLVNQTLPEIEIICIYNTNSHEKTNSILKEYQLIDNRIKIINCDNEKNTINLGFKNSSGKYIHFITPENWIESDLYEKGYEKCELNNLDMAIFQNVKYNLITKEHVINEKFDLISRHSNLCNKVLNAHNLENIMFSIPNLPQYVLFKRELLEKLNLSQNSNKETLFFYKALLNSTNISFIPKKVYFTPNNEYHDNHQNIIALTNEIIELFKEMDFYDDYKSYLLNYKCNLIWQNYNELNDERKIQMYNQIKSDFDNIADIDDYELCLNEENRILFNNIISTKTHDEFLMLVELQHMRNKCENLKNELELYKIQNEKYRENPNNQLNYDFTELSKKYEVKRTQLAQLNKDYSELSEKYLNLEKELQKYNLRLDQLGYKIKLIEKSINNPNKSKIKQIFNLKRFSK